MTEKINLGFKKMHQAAKLPAYGRDGDACFDFFTLEKTLLHAGEKKLVRTGVAADIPQGFEIQIRPRSGVALKTDLRICNSPGTIDETYLNEICIIIENTGKQDYFIEQYDRIAQGKISPVFCANIFEVVEIEKETVRGLQGFGSSGR